MPSLLTLLLVSATARAQSVERPVLPFRSVAGEDGVHVLYSNPSLMNFDRDPGYAVYYDTSSVQGGLNSLTFATTGGGVGAGLGYRQWGPDGEGWWTVTSGASLRLAEALSFGSSLNWQLPDGGDNNFVSWDIGLGWRPVPFLGLGGSVLNLGSPAPDLGVDTTYVAGVAIRPLGDVVTLGADYLATTPPDALADQRVQASLRLRPARGLWLRVFGEQGITDPAHTAFGGALEVRFADVGVGVTARSTLAAPDAVGGGGYVQTVPLDDQLFRGNRSVATFRIDQGYPYQPQGGLLLGPAPEGYLTLLRRIESATRDRQVRGLLFEIETTPFSMAQIEEIRDLIGRARDNGKTVVAYLGGEASNGAYLLAAACDKVYLHPAGQLDLVGMSAELQFFRGALDLVGVEAQYAKRAEYKSAPEQWTNDRSSDPAREEMEALLDDLYGALVEGIAAGRGKKAEEVRELIDTGPFTGDEALKAGLVDGLVYRDKLDEQLEDAFKSGWSRDEEYGTAPDMSGWAPQRAVAVVVVDGVIASGESSPGGLLGGAATGSETVVKALDQARRADAVKAVVLRVDSPGGSAFASDEIWRGVQRVREAGKPVIVSMGGYAASGGYYVAAGADAIYAEPSTVTGSIGVYGGKFNAEGLFDKLDIHTEHFARGRNATMYSLAKPFDDVEFAALDRMISDTYRQFKEKVRDGRSLSDEKVEEVARGRVWSGTDAKEHGLVDVHGGFFDAVERARMEAGMRPKAPWELVTYDPWVPSGADLPAYVVRAFQPRVETPEQLRPFFDLMALRDERIFAMLPWRLEIQ
ncbi:MAG: signal peptide peptidase SppA [Myxococcota bacterium]